MSAFMFDIIDLESISEEIDIGSHSSTFFAHHNSAQRARSDPEMGLIKQL